MSGVNHIAIAVCTHLSNRVRIISVVAHFRCQRTTTQQTLLLRMKRAMSEQEIRYEKERAFLLVPFWFFSL